MSSPLLTVDGLEVRFETDEGTVHAVNDVSFSVDRGEIVGLVGESGAGKSVTGRSLLRLVEAPGEITAGRIVLDGHTIVDAANPDNELKEPALRSEIRGQRIALIPQDPMESLNPVFTVGAQLNEVIRSNRGVTKAEAKEIAIEMLFEVGIPDPSTRYGEYPHQFSGGMRQRVLIAMALACEPDLIISDEPTTALDVTVEGQVLQLVKDIQADYNTSFIWITHDMGVVAELCDRVNVMYLGEIVEQADVGRLFNDPQHPYTRSLLASIPRADRIVDELETIAGEPPNALRPPAGCRFHPRCPDARKVCQEEHPTLEVAKNEGDEDRVAACFKHEAFNVGYEVSEPLDTEATRRGRPELSTDGGDTDE